MEFAGAKVRPVEHFERHLEYASRDDAGAAAKLNYNNYQIGLWT